MSNYGLAGMTGCHAEVQLVGFFVDGDERWFVFVAFLEAYWGGDFYWEHFGAKIDGDAFCGILWCR